MASYLQEHLLLSLVTRYFVVVANLAIFLLYVVYLNMTLSAIPCIPYEFLVVQIVFKSFCTTPLLQKTIRSFVSSCHHKYAIMLNITLN